MDRYEHKELNKYFDDNEIESLINMWNNSIEDIVLLEEIINNLQCRNSVKDFIARVIEDEGFHRQLANVKDINLLKK